MKRLDGRFFWALVAPLIASIGKTVISSVLKGITGKVVRRSERRYMNKNV